MRRSVGIAVALFLGLTLLAAPVAADPLPTGDMNPKPWACGAKVRKADGSLWTCRFVEHFSGRSLDLSSWTVHRGSNNISPPGQQFVCALDDPDNLQVRSGRLHLTVRREPSPFPCVDDRNQEPFTAQYSAATISQLDKLDVTYARVEVRAKLPTARVPGIHSAIWMYPQEEIYGTWPRSGEIDITEYYTRYPDRSIPYLHYVRDPGDPVTNNFCKLNPRLYHRFLLEWTPGLITVKHDGKICLTHRIDPAAPLTGSAPFDQPFHLILTQTLGVGQNPFDPLTTPLPQTLLIDWVKIWV